ncbi:MAG TPA: Ig-like domain-containing protein [Longimicrobium sp.]|nr:Ig-like domain-containing protein [Longimicrobium sp.]
MKLARSHAARAATALAIMAGAAACIDSANPVGPAGEPAGPGEGAPPIELVRMQCTANVRAGTVQCAGPVVAGASADLVYGGQNRFVALTSTNATYDAVTHKFTFDVRVRNLLRQAIGTTDGTTADPSGVKVFMVQPPYPTEGTGNITIDNADGTGTFSRSEPQPFFRYVTRLAQYEQSAARTWQFDVDPSVATFAFSVAIASPVRYPTGWIETSLDNFSLRRTFSRLVTATVYDQFGTPIPDAVVTWSSANTARATVPADSGLVTGLLPGAVDIVATSTNDVPGTVGATQAGSARFNIAGVALTWTNGGGSNDWNAPANWDRGVQPVAEDSVTVPVVGSDIYPVLVENESIGAVTVGDGARIEIGAFNLTASQNVISAPFTGGILGTSGRVELTGTEKTVSGRFPRMRVSGRYSLVGNVEATAPIRVESGRLRNAEFRLRAISR